MIPIDDNELTTDNMTKQWKHFIEHMKDNIRKDKQPLFDGTDTDRVHFSAFGDTNYTDNNMLPYG